MQERLPQPVHPNDDSSPAPGDLELVRSFLSLHDHTAGDSVSLAPSVDTVAWWLRDRGLVTVDSELSQKDLEWALQIREALVAKVRENMGGSPDTEAARRLNDAAIASELRPRFDEPRLDPATDGVRGAIGRLLGVAFLAQLEGSWHRFRLCADPTCRSVFYDRSKNHSAKWCSMQTCGNRNKVRTFRERRAPTA